MDSPKSHISTIIDKTPATEKIHILQDIQLGNSEHEHELLLFVKPDVFALEDKSKTEKVLGMIFDKLAQHQAHVKGMAIVGGQALEEKGIMDRHYGFINQLSRNASTLITQEERAKMLEMLELDPDGTYRFLGGHEYLALHPELSVKDLDDIWWTKKSIKLKSGFYFQIYDLDNQQTILINAFHPLQLAQFTGHDRRILLMLIGSNTDWKTLRQELVGDSFPEKAHPNSIRGTLFASPEEYGFSEVTIANNGVHLSAGPFEAAFEVTNFFGNLFDMDIRENKPRLIHLLEEMGMSYDKAVHALTNPQLSGYEKPTSLFSVTEDMNAKEAAELWMKEGAKE